MAEWPRMPYLNDELREWISAQLATLGVDEIALYAVDPQRGQDEERRVLVATEVGLIDGWYAPRGGSSARYGFTARLWPWQAVRGVDLRNETYRVWALEHRTRWWLRLARPGFEAETDAPELGAALCDIAKVCAVMAEPAGWQAAQEEVPVRRETLRVVPSVTEVPPEAGSDVEMVAPTGRPAVPPPMVSPPLPAQEPQPIRPRSEIVVDAEADVEAAESASRDEGPEEAAAAAVTDQASPVTDETEALSEADASPEPEISEATPDVADAEAEIVATPHAAEEAIEEAIEEPPATADDGAVPVGEQGGDHVAGAEAERIEAPPAIEAPPPSPAEMAPLESSGSETTSEPGSAHDEDAQPGEAVAAESSPTTNGAAAPRPRERGLGIGIGPFRRSPAPPPAANGDAPPRDEEEVLNLGDVGAGEEPINLDEYDPDPLGLRGPLHR